MSISALSVFFIALLISFFGSLPFGPINLVMIDTTLKHSLRASWWFAVAAALVEMGQSLVALYGSSWVVQLMEGGPWIKLTGFMIFLLLGILFLLKKGKDSTVPTNGFQRSFFVKGLLVAVMNPQAIPFWVIMLALLSSTISLHISAESQTSQLFSFIMGASFGKLGALLLFGILSERIISRSTLIRQHINRIIGIILISIGMFQGILAMLG
ncbi:MAG: LysE family transporter [Saprospiraceae bacterium]